MSKLCTKCGITKALSEFSVSRRNANQVLKEGSTFKRASNKEVPEMVLHSYCKQCNAEYARAFRKRYKEMTGNSDYRGSGKTNKYPKEDRPLISAIRSRITSTKGNCRKSNVEFRVDEEYLFDLYKEQEGLCALTGWPMAINGNTNLRLSLDRKDPSIGYLENNLQWTIFAANRAKGDLTQEDFIKLCGMVLERATTIESTSNSEGSK